MTRSIARFVTVQSICMKKKTPAPSPTAAVAPVPSKKKGKKKKQKEADMESHDSQEPDNMSTSTTSNSSTNSHKWAICPGVYSSEYVETKMADMNERVRELKKKQGSGPETDGAGKDTASDTDVRQLELVCIALGCGKPFSGTISEQHPNVRCTHCSVVHLISPEGKAVYVFLTGKRSVRCLHCQTMASVLFGSDQCSFKCEKCDTVHLLRVRGKSPIPGQPRKSEDTTVHPSSTSVCCFCFPCVESSVIAM